MDEAAACAVVEGLQQVQEGVSDAPVFRAALASAYHCHGDHPQLRRPIAPRPAADLVDGQAGGSGPEQISLHEPAPEGAHLPAYPIRTLCVHCGVGGDFIACCFYALLVRD